MRQNFINNVVVTLLVLFFSISNLSSASAESCILKARVTNIPPLYYKDDSGEWSGLTVDLANVLLNEVGCKGDFESISWSRSLDLLKTGGIDMMMNLSKTKDREKFIHFIGPQSIETAQLLTKKNIAIDINSLEDFKKLPGIVGYQQGSFYGKEFHEKLKSDPEFNGKFEVVFSQEFNLNKLKSDRIIGILGQNYSGVSAQKDLLNSNEYKVHPYIIHHNEVYFGFSKKSVLPEIISKLNEAYDRATNNKEFHRVIESYK
ncbi:ABC transporter substrate-binding protein [uncultured Cocleimonas sp.]|uniref:substrate-binding periplasmic protein n=1 Tax=uncultured Cocleimonas sp. TaxID=1051587 RepID=UPI002611EC08|nr:transporter substrate-binding domain-containing protein [uncultured Cocleimonas sp.]